MATAQAAEQAGKLDFQFLVNIAIGIVGTLAMLVYRGHVSQYERERDAQMSQRHDDHEQYEKDRNADRQRHERDFEALKGLIEARAGEASKMNAELWQEIKESRSDRRRVEEEFIRQLNNTRERQAQLELLIAKSYHTKEDLARIMDEKLIPVVESLRELRKMGPLRRLTDRDES